MLPESGIRSWNDFVEPYPIRLSSGKIASIKNHIDLSQKHLAHQPEYFAGLLAPDQHWRLFPHFRHSTAFLDIKTTGLDKWGGSITTIALYDGRSIFHYVQGENLEAFREDIQKYQVIVTYNGKCFDVPFIESYLGIKIEQVHIDLRYVLKRPGYSGGLKGCERQLGLRRGELDGVDGYFAVAVSSLAMVVSNSHSLRKDDHSLLAERSKGPFVLRYKIRPRLYEISRSF
jgi:uncharacterized protein YprB with RNaseH-like and TPR domain